MPRDAAQRSVSGKPAIPPDEQHPNITGTKQSERLCIAIERLILCGNGVFGYMSFLLIHSPKYLSGRTYYQGTSM